MNTLYAMFVGNLMQTANRDACKDTLARYVRNVMLLVDHGVEFAILKPFPLTNAGNALQSGISYPSVFSQG